MSWTKGPLIHHLVHFALHNSLKRSATSVIRRIVLLLMDNIQIYIYSMHFVFVQRLVWNLFETSHSSIVKAPYIGARKRLRDENFVC